MLAAGVAVSVALAAGPAGASFEVTVLVVSTKEPTLVGRTDTEIVHEAPAARLLELTLKVPAPGLIVVMPPPTARVPQVPPVRVINFSPAGTALLNVTWVNVLVVGFVAVTVKMLVLPTATEAGLKAALSVAVATSTAPISQAAPCGRDTPRWSVLAQVELLPASMAELPTPGSIVCVNPPLLASAPSLGSVVKT